MGGGSGPALGRKGNKRKYDERKEEEAYEFGGARALPRDKFHNRLDEATVNYFVEVKTHFDGLGDDDERHRLVTNVLEETRGKELQVATDATCSRVLEALIPHVVPAVLIQFLQAFLKQGTLITLACNPFGSHVLEKALEVTSGWQAHEELVTLTEDLLTQVTHEVAANLHSLVVDRYGSHVARHLLSTVAGRDLSPPKSASNAKDGAVWLGASKARQQASGLGAKLGAEQSRLPAPHTPPHPSLIRVLVNKLLSKDSSGALVEDLPFCQYASPFLQALLLATLAETNLALQLIARLLGSPGEKPGNESTSPLGHVNPSFVVAMAEDQSASRFLEAIILHAPPVLRDELELKVLKGKLALLSMHPRANYVVQAALGSCTSPAQVKGALKELKGSVGQLLLGKRAGVVVALAAAVGGTPAAEKELSDTIVSELEQHRPAAQANGMGRAEQLVTLGISFRLADAGPHARLSVLGCALLARLLHFTESAASPFTTSLAALSAADVVNLGSDSAGSRVLEAYAECSMPAKAKKKLLRKLVGHYGTLAALPGGCHVVEKCYGQGGLKEKQIIVSELVAAEQSLGEAHRTVTLLRKCNAEEYKRSPEVWRARVEHKAALQSKYAELFKDACTSMPQMDRDGQPSNARHPSSATDQDNGGQEGAPQKVGDSTVIDTHVAEEPAASLAGKVPTEKREHMETKRKQDKKRDSQDRSQKKPKKKMKQA